MERKLRGHDPNRAAQFIEACRSNPTFTAVARALGISRVTVTKLAKRHGIKALRGLEIPSTK